jgi:RHS repeat-associated protein
MVYGERINELLEHTDVTDDPDGVYYAHADKLDSVMLLVLADGSITESYRYTDYGQPTVVDDTFVKLTVYSSNINNWKRYTGQEHALPSSSGDPWYWYRARAYRADAGRFVQRDPLAYVDSSNLYSYALASPLVYVDPTGTDSLCTHLLRNAKQKCIQACEALNLIPDTTPLDIAACKLGCAEVAEEYAPVAEGLCALISALGKLL